MNKWLGGGDHVRNECLNICLFKEKSAELWSDQRSVTLFDSCVTLCFLVDIFDTGMLITRVLPTTRSTAALDQNIQYSEDGELLVRCWSIVMNLVMETILRTNRSNSIILTRSCIIQSLSWYQSTLFNPQPSFSLTLSWKQGPALAVVIAENH